MTGHNPGAEPSIGHESPEGAHDKTAICAPTPTAGELWARVQAAEKEEEAARERYEAFEVLDPSSEWCPPEYEQADLDYRRAWVRAEEARHGLDAFLNPKRYAEKGYRAEALDKLRAQAEAEPPKAPEATQAQRLP